MDIDFSIYIGKWNAVLLVLQINPILQLVCQHLLGQLDFHRILDFNKCFADETYKRKWSNHHYLHWNSFHHIFSEKLKGLKNRNTTKDQYRQTKAGY